MVTHTERRLSIIKDDPVADGMTDGALTYRLNMALNKALNYTHQSTDQGEIWDGVIIELAINSIIMSGADNTTAINEGGISRTWSDIPDSLKKRLNSYRRIQGLSE